MFEFNLLCPDSAGGKVWVLSCVLKVGGGFLRTGGGGLITERGGSCKNRRVNTHT